MESNIVLLIPLGVWDFDRHVDCKIAKRPPSEGAAEGGCGGNSAAPERRSPAAPPEYLEGGTRAEKYPLPF